jgi:NAD(P)-dependent dehydrogenase (short-subunit alcohol dehydrogenase family)
MDPGTLSRKVPNGDSRKRTPFQDRIWPSEAAKQDFGAASVPGRMGTSEEMAKVVAFLASDDASFVSGSGVLADGGYTVA